MRMNLSLFQHQPTNTRKAAFLIVLCLMLLQHTISVKEASASGIGLAIDPPVISIRAATPFQQDVSITLENIGTESVSTTIQYLPFAPSKKNDGTVQYLPTGEMYLNADRTIFNAVRVLEDNQNISNTVIAPKQKKRLTARFDLEESIKPGDYYFSLVFVAEQEKPEDATSHTLLRSAIASHVLLTVLPGEEANPLLAEFRTEAVHEQAPIPFIIRVQNPTHTYLEASGSLRIVNIFGRTVSRIDLPSQTVLAKSSRYLGRELPADAGEGKTPAVLTHTNLLAGPYTAHLEITGGNGQPIQRTISFIVLPFHGVLLLLALLFSLFIIARRVRAKLSR